MKHRFMKGWKKILKKATTIFTNTAIKTLQAG